MIDTKDLLKWLDIEQLQMLQNSFTEMTGLSVVTVDKNGYPITEKTGSSVYCDILVQSSKLGCRLCKSCAKYGAEEALNGKGATQYYCHMGLIELCIPIIVEEELVASIIGGMVFENPPVEERIRSYARHYNIDEDALWAAAKKVPVVNIKTISKSTAFLHSIANFLTSSINGHIQMELAGKEFEKAANMKTDFVANMSHEIRTPMNAVIGMADVALREEMSPTAEEYVRQIQTSGKSLLHIINDILDYSKMSSGKMDIFDEEYSPATIIRDVSTIIMNRLREKETEVSLIVDVDPFLPTKLIGDGPRIQQVLINIANNAVKFTREGYVRISVKYKKKDETHITLYLIIEDTGIGIKSSDLDKLFHSFTQVDSKRNRNVEGTGLGLAIVDQLVTLMGGTVSVSSIYGTGSTFTVEIPQVVAVNEPIAKIDNPNEYAVFGVFSNPNTGISLKNALDLCGVSITLCANPNLHAQYFSQWFDRFSSYKTFIFVEETLASSDFFAKINIDNPKYSNLTSCIVFKAFSLNDQMPDKKEFLQIHEPLYSANLATLINNSSKPEICEKETFEEFFSANEAKILVVDDNKVNVKVADKLFSLFDITIDKAYSGKECLDMIMLKRYDIIFMDHMMPELDGIDTTRLIRRFHPKMNSIPIIALTANAVDEARKLFLSEGMNDFIAKPIEVKVLGEKLQKWLPPERITYTK